MSRRGAELARTVIALAGLFVAAGGAVTLLAPVRTATVISVGGIGGTVATVLLVAAAGLVAAGAAGWFARPGVLLGLIGFWGAAAWLAPEMAGTSGVTREARSLGSLVAPMIVPLLVHLPVRTLGADAVRGMVRWGLAALYLVTAITALGRSLTWDPFFVLDCSPVCRRGDNVFLVHVDIPLANAFTSVGLVAGTMGGLGLAAWASVRMWRHPRQRRRDLVVLLPAAVVGLMISWGTVARLTVHGAAHDDGWLLVPMVALGFSIAALGGGVAWLAVRERQRMDAMGRLVELMNAGAGSRSLRETLAAVLGDSTIRVAYPLPARQAFVDEQGDVVTEPAATAGRSVTAIERRSGVVALVEHDAGLDPALLSQQVGSAARLAVDNERLEATVRAQLRELAASRARIVAVADAARGRLERDLHDGAQQRLLAVSFELRLARSAAADASTDRLQRLDEAITEIDQALAELRDLAHGIHPAILAEAGLEAALRSLAEDAPLILELDGLPEERCDPAAERAAYQAIVEAVRRAVAAGTTRLDVQARRADGMLRLELAGGGLGEGPWVRVEDRVGAAGGRLTITPDAGGGTLVGVELPCA